MNTKDKIISAVCLLTLALIAIVTPDGCQPIVRVSAPANETESQTEHVGKADSVATDVAEQVVARFDNEPGLSYEESHQILKLSNATWPTKCEVIRFGLSEEHLSERISTHAACVAHAVIALDPSAELSEELLRDFLVPVIRDSESPAESVAAAFALMRHLRVPRATSVSLLFEWLEDENNSVFDIGQVLSSYLSDLNQEDSAAMAALIVRRTVSDPKNIGYGATSSLGILTEKLQPEVVKPLAGSLVKRLKGEDNEDSLRSLCNALDVLAPKLDRRDALSMTKTILEYVSTEQDDAAITEYVLVLGKLSAPLSAADVRPLVAFLRDRLMVQQGVYEVNMLSSVMTNVAVKLDTKEVHSIVNEIVTRIKKEDDGDVRAILSETAARLSVNLEPADAKPIADWIMEEIDRQQGYYLAELSKSLQELAGHLDAVDRARLADRILQRIKAERDWGNVYHLTQTLAELIVDLEIRELRRFNSSIAAQMLDENVGSRKLEALAEAIGAIANKLSSEELLPVISVLIERINSEDELFSRGELVAVLDPLAKRLNAKHARPIVAKLVQRMTTETDAQFLADLGQIVAATSANLEPAEVQAAIVALAERIQVEQMDSSLERLMHVFMNLAPRWEPTARRSFVLDLQARMRTERDGNELVMLAELLRHLTDQMQSHDVDLACSLIVERFESERDGQTLVQLAEVLIDLPCQLAPERRVAAAEDLLASLARARYIVMPGYGPREELSGLQSIVAEAGLQSLVDALKAPLLVDEFVANAILRAVEDKIGKNFDGDRWKFVDWASKDPEGARLALDLSGAGPWSALEESSRKVFPPLQGVSFKEQGSLKIEGAVWSFVVDGDVAYLPAGTSGLRLVDVSDPTNPYELGHAKAGPSAMAVCVAGDYAYVTAGPAGWPESHLHVVDISNAKAPEVIGSIDLPDYPSGVAVRDKNVFVADHSEGLRVIDVSDPKMPKEVGSLETPGFIVDVALAGNYAFLADREVGVRAVDIAKPDAPKEVGLLRTAGPCIDVCIKGNRAYVATGQKGLVVIDITNPRSLKHVATVDTELAVSASVHDSLAVVGTARLGVKVLDLTDPTKPSARDLKMSGNGAGSFHRGDYAFVSDVSLGGGPYGMDNHTILRVYQVIAADDAKGDTKQRLDQSPGNQRDGDGAPSVKPQVKTSHKSDSKDWSATANISNDEGTSMMPALEVDRLGKVHLAWMGKSGGIFDIFYSRWNDNGWSTPIKVAASTRQSMFPSMAIDSSGEVHLVWMEGQAERFDIYYSRRTGTQWSKAINISDTKGISQRPKLVLDSSGTLQVVWYDNTGGSFELWHAQRKDGNWVQPVSTKLVDWYITHDPSLTLGPGLAADSRGNIHVIWADIDLFTQHLFYSRWDGKVWSRRQKVSGPHHRRCSEATIAVEATGIVHAAWYDKDRSDVRYGWLGGDGWSKPVRIGSRSAMPAISADSAGVAHLAWIQGKDILYSKNTDNTWSAAINISKSSGNVAAPAIATDTGGIVHIAWMDDRPGNFDILYRRSLRHE